MAGNISSLGIGSGVLTADVIDQLRAADERAQIKPTQEKIDLNEQKQEAYSLLTSLMTSFKASASALSFDTVFQDKNVSSSGDAKVTIDEGFDVDSFTLETLELAKKDITKLGAVADRDQTKIAGSSGTLTIANGDQTFEVDYNATMTLQDLSQAITDAGGDTFSSSILQTGEGAFNLMITSKETGEAQQLEITDTSGNLNAALFAAADPATNPNGFNKVQAGEDASFKYNGILISRSTNTFSDLIGGVNITLGKKDDFSSINVSLNKEPIMDEMQLLVDGYNELVGNLKDMTLSDQESGQEGIFNNDSFVKSLSRELSSIVTEFSNGSSLVDYGIELLQDGRMSFNSSVLSAKIDADPEGVKKAFTGSTDANGEFTPGIFNTMDESLSNYTGSNKMLSNYATALEDEAKSFRESLERSTQSLNERYETMASRFAAYDSMIASLNSQFSSIQMMIDQAGQ